MLNFPPVRVSGYLQNSEGPQRCLLTLRIQASSARLACKCPSLNISRAHLPTWPPTTMVALHFIQQCCSFHPLGCLGNPSSVPILPPGSKHGKHFVPPERTSQPSGQTPLKEISSWPALNEPLHFTWKNSRLVELE